MTQEQLEALRRMQQGGGRGGQAGFAGNPQGLPLAGGGPPMAERGALGVEEMPDPDVGPGSTVPPAAVVPGGTHRMTIMNGPKVSLTDYAKGPGGYAGSPVTSPTDPEAMDWVKNGYQVEGVNAPSMGMGVPTAQVLAQMRGQPVSVNPMTPSGPAGQPGPAFQSFQQFLQSSGMPMAGPGYGLEQQMQMYSSSQGQQLAATEAANRLAFEREKMNLALDPMHRKRDFVSKIVEQAVLSGRPIAEAEVARMADIYVKTLAAQGVASPAAGATAPAGGGPTPAAGQAPAGGAMPGGAFALRQSLGPAIADQFAAIETGDRGPEGLRKLALLLRQDDKARGAAGREGLGSEANKALLRGELNRLYSQDQQREALFPGRFKLADVGIPALGVYGAFGAPGMAGAGVVPGAGFFANVAPWLRGAAAGAIKSTGPLAGIGMGINKLFELAEPARGMLGMGHTEEQEGMAALRDLLGWDQQGFAFPRKVR